MEKDGLWRSKNRAKDGISLITISEKVVPLTIYLYREMVITGLSRQSFSALNTLRMPKVAKIVQH